MEPDKSYTRRCVCHPQIAEADPTCPAHGTHLGPKRFREGWDAAVRGDERYVWQTDEWKAGYDDLMRERTKDIGLTGNEVS